MLASKPGRVGRVPEGPWRAKDARRIAALEKQNVLLVRVLENLRLNMRGDVFVDPLKRKMYLEAINFALDRSKLT